MKTETQKIMVEFKYDNRDVVTVKNAPNHEIAMNYANDFLNNIDDPDADYLVPHQFAHDNFNEDGSIDFMVKCYDKNS